MTEGWLRLSDFCFPTSKGMRLAPLKESDLIPGNCEDAYFQSAILNPDQFLGPYKNGARAMLTIGHSVDLARPVLEAYLNRWISIPPESTVQQVGDWWVSLSHFIFHFPSVISAALSFHATESFFAPFVIPVMMCSFLPGYFLDFEGESARSLPCPKRISSLSDNGSFSIFCGPVINRLDPLPPTTFGVILDIPAGPPVPNVHRARSLLPDGTSQGFELYTYYDPLFDRLLFEAVDVSPAGMDVLGSPVFIGDTVISCMSSIVLDRCLNLIRRYMLAINKYSKIKEIARYDASIFPVPAHYYTTLDDQHQVIMCIAKIIEDFHWLPANVSRYIGFGCSSNAELYARLMGSDLLNVSSINCAHSVFLSSLV
jgi:hypothetical protein